jgi:hypothetical protein
MTKPTAAQVWRRLVDEAGEDQIAAVLSLTQEQVDAELAGAGFDLGTERAKADQFLEDLVSGALDESLGFHSEAPESERAPTSAVVAIAQPQHRPEPPHRRRPRTTLVLLLAATAAAAAGATYVAMHQEPTPAPPSPLPSAPLPEPAPSPTASVVPDLVAAADWRSKAIAACDSKDFETCLADLDIARALDPDGDDTPLVRRTRDRAIKGVLDKAPTSPKPPKP